MALRLTSSFMRNALVAACRQNSTKLNNCCVTRNLSSKLLTSQSFMSARPSTAYFSTKADVALSEFLKSEIEQEKEVGKKQLGATAPKVEGFDAKTEEAEVILTKTHNNEKITVKFNVNQSTSEDFDEFEPNEKSEPDAPKVWSKPEFQVEIVKNNQRLIFECEFPEQDYDDEIEAGAEDVKQDEFNINMVYFSNGEVTEKVYGAMGSILDGNLYAHLMEFLDERGINNKFADDLVKFASHYEHGQYVNLLQNIRSFVSK